MKWKISNICIWVGTIGTVISWMWFMEDFDPESSSMEALLCALLPTSAIFGVINLISLWPTIVKTEKNRKRLEEKRLQILRENIEAWNRRHKKFINKMAREDYRIIMQWVNGEWEYDGSRGGSNKYYRINPETGEREERDYIPFT